MQKSITAATDLCNNAGKAPAAQLSRKRSSDEAAFASLNCPIVPSECNSEDEPGLDPAKLLGRDPKALTGELILIFSSTTPLTCKYGKMSQD